MWPDKLEEKVYTPVCWDVEGCWGNKFKMNYKEFSLGHVELTLYQLSL